MLIMTQKEAADLGLVTYRTGVPCKRGHVGERYTKSRACVECVALKRGLTLNRRNRSLKNNKLSEEARERGETTYIPEKPCKRGHLLRFVDSNNCVECDKIMAEKHKITQKFSRIKKEYGLSKEQYMSMVKKQNSSCVICGEYREDYFSLHIDHCHNTGKVRSLLCSKCNQAIGLLKHSPKLLRIAANYCE